MRVRLTDGADGAVVLRASYRDWSPLLEAFKAVIPWDGRTWDGTAKLWVIHALYVADLLTFLAKHGAHVQDDRQPTPAVEARTPMPDDLRDAYMELYLLPEAPLCVAEAAYRALAKYYHPDAGGEAESFHAISTAIRVVRFYLNPQEDHDDELPF